MILVDLDQVSVSRPNRPLFRNVSVTVSAGDRLGVVGINGTGKSTLLSLMAGSAEPEDGTIRRGNGVEVATLEQVTRLVGVTVREAVGHGWRGEAALDRLGVGDLLDRRVDELSGGQEKRVALARAMVADADLLVLDEPTNHLDVDAIEWLENELAGFKGGLVLVTHDRHVLDRLTTRILELDRGDAHIYEGGYADYLQGRAARTAREEAAEATRRNLARRELDWLRRGPKARTSKSRARIDRAHQLIDGVPPPPARGGALELDALHEGTPRLGDQVVELHSVTVGFDPVSPLITGLDLLLGRRERLGVVGPNGAGKSTLLDVIAGRRAPLAGDVVVGPTARISLYDQAGRDLDPAAKVRDLVAGDGDPQGWDIALMERFWFDSDAQHAAAGLLSGGERRRLQLVLTLAERPNVLLLDEPTNDLDLDTLRALEDFLDGWPGAVVVISHDRAFLDRTIDDVLVVDSGVATRWPEGYEGWLRDRKDRRATPQRQSRETKPPAPRSDRRSMSTIRHEIKLAERQMAALQHRRDELVADLELAGSDHERLAEVGAALAACDDELASAETRWLELSDEMEQR